MKTFTLILGLFASAISQLSAGSYKIEAIAVPHYVVPEVGGLGFTPEGELVVALRRHGILMAQPSEDPTDFPWRAFSTDSLHNPCGIQIISKDEIIVSQMPELTRISDTDGDGIADSYENVADSWGVSGNYHETNALVPDGEGGWYVAVGTASHNGPTFEHTRGTFEPMGRIGRNFSAVPWKGWVVHIDSEGNSTPIAGGFRAPNGIAMDQQGHIFATDNQGDWRGTSPLYHVEKGNFYGHPSSLVWDKEFTASVSVNPLQYYIDDFEQYQEDRTRAVIEFPHGFICNSPSEPHFDTTGGSFGPFAGQAFVGDIAGDRILRCMIEEVDGVLQGAVVKFIDGGIGGGTNRLAFSPDGKSLYVGQTYRGWGNLAEGLKRITFTGEMPFDLQKIALQPDGFRLTFTKQLDQESAGQLANYSAKSYWYKSHHQYGSPQMDDRELPVESVTINGNEAVLVIPGLEPDRIVELNLADTLLAEDGTPIAHGLICYTIRKLKP
ncbi:hypothetical protein [Pelagicoccus sp. SDUM812002]|uniref:DUF7133 domain-containing protein n=1 Tax=Pelagicoccus sp. SDUM812002 TaxID=3041266 RepID=UPI00280CDE9E|nr:hypothetical protein [Pelagicoccus sp. SDUM812002]MDQ8187967.1 hypothetical protein [Pelagicoccus sp. SDUM812002]